MRRFTAYGPSVIVLLTAAVVLFLGPRAVQQLTYEHTRTQIIQARHNLESTDVLERINQAYRDIARVVEPSVVHIGVHYTDRDVFGNERRGISTGSGWVFDEHGHIVTNHHVVLNATRIDVQLYNGLTREATLVGADPSTDIAVLKIEPGLLHPALLGDVRTPVSQGDLVFAFGSPFDFRFSMSAGVVSGKDRSVGVIRDEIGRRAGYENFIQVDAAINPGNSGGPLTDYRGRVIGMNTAIATGRRANSFEEGSFAGIGLAIPLDMIYPVVTQLIQNGFVEKGFLGVRPVNLTRDLLQQLNYSGTGVFIEHVEPDSAAARAGVQVGDIVTHVGTRSVSTVEQLRSLVSSMFPGENATLRIWRVDPQQQSPTSLELQVALDRLDTLPIDGRIVPDSSRQSIPALGIMRMETSTPELCRDLGVPFRQGVLLLTLRPGTFISRQLRPGSIVTSVMDHDVHSIDEFLDVLRQYDLRFRGVRVQAHEPDGRVTSANLIVE